MADSRDRVNQAALYTKRSDPARGCRTGSLPFTTTWRSVNCGASGVDQRSLGRCDNRRPRLGTGRRSFDAVLSLRRHRLQDQASTTTAGLARGERVGGVRCRCNHAVQQGVALARVGRCYCGHRRRRRRVGRCGARRCHRALHSRACWWDYHRRHEINVILIRTTATAQGHGYATKHENACAKANGQRPVRRGVGIGGGGVLSRGERRGGSNRLAARLGNGRSRNRRCCCGDRCRRCCLHGRCLCGGRRPRCGTAWCRFSGRRRCISGGRFDHGRRSHRCSLDRSGNCARRGQNNSGCGGGGSWCEHRSRGCGQNNFLCLHHCGRKHQHG
jgi:hypothetical protein